MESRGEQQEAVGGGGVGRPPLVTTPRMHIFLLQEQDRREFVRVHEVSRSLFDPWSPAMPPDMTFDLLFDQQLRSAGELSNSTHYLRTVGRLSDGRIAGFFNLNEIVHGASCCAFAGWRVNQELGGQGFGTEGVFALLDLAFTPLPRGLGLHRVQANIIPRNTASLRIAEKVGFRQEGLAQRYLKIAGSWEDHVMFALVADEYVLRYPKPR